MKPLPSRRCCSSVRTNLSRSWSSSSPHKTSVFPSRAVARRGWRRPHAWRRARHRAVPFWIADDRVGRVGLSYRERRNCLSIGRAYDWHVDHLVGDVGLAGFSRAHVAVRARTPVGLRVGKAAPGVGVRLARGVGELHGLVLGVFVARKVAARRLRARGRRLGPRRRRRRLGRRRRRQRWRGRRAGRRRRRRWRLGSRRWRRGRGRWRRGRGRRRRGRRRGRRRRWRRRRRRWRGRYQRLAYAEVVDLARVERLAGICVGSLWKLKSPSAVIILNLVARLQQCESKTKL